MRVPPCVCGRMYVCVFVCVVLCTSVTIGNPRKKKQAQQMSVNRGLFFLRYWGNSSDTDVTMVSMVANWDIRERRGDMEERRDQANGGDSMETAGEGREMEGRKKDEGRGAIGEREMRGPIREESQGREARQQ